MTTSLPTYQQLLSRTDAPPGTTWSLFGDESDLGTINLLTPEVVVGACHSVTRGAVFRLDLPMNAIDPPIAKHRKPAEHVIFQNGPNHRDDYIDRVYLQNGTHLDGLRHIRHHVHGFYNGAPDNSVTVESDRLGIGAWAQRGVVGRAVLLDVARHLESLGRGLNHDSGEAFGVDVLDACIEREGVEIHPGDMLLIRTGWLNYYFNRLDRAGRADVRARLRSSGLEQSEEMLEWLWDRRISLVASDNAAVECYPPLASSPFRFESSDSPGHDPGLMHPQLIAMLGLAIGELWALDELAADCASDGRYDCLLAVAPLNLPAGVGSPANATAIK